MCSCNRIGGLWCVTYHLSTMPKTTATDPPPATTMKSRLVHQDRTPIKLVLKNPKIVGPLKKGVLSFAILAIYSLTRSLQKQQLKHWIGLGADSLNEKYFKSLWHRGRWSNKVLLFFNFKNENYTNYIGVVGFSLWIELDAFVHLIWSENSCKNKCFDVMQRNMKLVSLYLYLY